MKATHDGTCQICGSRQRLPAGRLAQHGYTVAHGFFEGTCPGSGHPAFLAWHAASAQDQPLGLDEAV